ncbi:MAG: cysteine desulfurase/selenocysteine lyase [Saprospiraceae bacterium]|jgi:cysteine desulfurase/selenocysteine lyase
MLDPVNIRKDFPIFINNPDLIYFDNAATTQKPAVVIKGISNYYENENANIHRGIYGLAASTTQKYELVRQKVADFIGAESPSNIVYTSGTTAGINLVAASFLANRLRKGDEVLISFMEHHANLIPWQMICKNRGAKLKVIPINRDGTIRKDAFKALLTRRTKMVALVHVSNSLGTINPIAEMIEIAHEQNIPVLIDGAQSVAHFEIDVKKWDADFFVFSGHKVFGPTGIGILYGKTAHLSEMAPVNYGGDIIKDVTFEKTMFLDPPQRFEAGTTNIAGVIGLGYAIDYLNNFNKKEIRKYLKNLRTYAINKLLNINGLRIIGSLDNSTSIISFVLEGIHPHDVATILGVEKIAVRAGHHCTQPVMDFLELPGTTRASFTIYNTPFEVDRMVDALKGIQQFFK